MADEPGNMVLIQGDKEAKQWLRSADRRVDDWLYELVYSMVFYAADRLAAHAPGSITELVETQIARPTATDSLEGIAGIIPDITQETFHSGLGSNPADYPVFVEVGTGVFGPVGHPISTIPGHLMGPFFDPEAGRDIFVQSIRGQRPQRYAEHSFDETVEWAPTKIREHLPELGRRE